jgi:hypothetical protein
MVCVCDAYSCKCGFISGVFSPSCAHMTHTNHHVTAHLSFTYVDGRCLVPPVRRMIDVVIVVVDVIDSTVDVVDVVIRLRRLILGKKASRTATRRHHHHHHQPPSMTCNACTPLNTAIRRNNVPAKFNEKERQTTQHHHRRTAATSMRVRQSTCARSHCSHSHCKHDKRSEHGHGRVAAVLLPHAQRGDHDAVDAHAKRECCRAERPRHTVTRVDTQAADEFET